MNLKRISIAAARLAVCLLLLASLAGCSTFSHDWKQAAARPAPAAGLEGRWTGTWLSDVNGHTGKLRCIVTKETGYQYEFHYWATFWKIFSTSYTVYLHANQTDTGYQFKGEEDLGRLAGGLYQYEGSVNGAKFTSSYKSKYDHGTFHMIRVE